MTYSTMKDLFKAICDAIRSKDGTTDSIPHQDIPERIMGLTSTSDGSSGGNAVGNDIRKGKHAYVNGKPVEGTLDEVSKIVMNDAVVDANIIEQDENFMFQAQRKYECILTENAYVLFQVNRNRFGDARPENVDFGVQFTSAEGVCMTGERPVDVDVGTDIGSIEVPNLSELHYWKKYIIQETAVESISISGRSTTYPSTGEWTGDSRISDKVTIKDGQIKLIEPSVANLTPDNAEELLIGKYAQITQSSNSGFYKFTEDTTFRTINVTNFGTLYADNVLKLSIDNHFVVSIDSLAFPENGEQGGFVYEYQGTLGG